jgi:hypothetical protein
MGSSPNRFGILALNQFDDAADGRLRIVSLHEVKVALDFGRAEIGHGALVYSMGVSDNPAQCGLPKHFSKPHHGHGARCNDVGEDLTRSDRRKLVNVSNN